MKRQISLNGTQLKLLAIICMTIDHAAFLFLSPDTTAYLLLRGIGRWTAPIMAFQLAEGFRHTRNYRNYLCRMLTFAVISQPFYLLMVNRNVPETLKEMCSQLNVMFPLVIGLIVMKLITMLKEKPDCYILYPALILCLIVTEFCDWKILIPAWAVLFCFVQKVNRKTMILYLVVTTVLVVAEFGSWYESFKDFSFQLGTLTAILPICLYNGQRGGGRRNAAKQFSRWTFYVYYPLHMAALTVIWLLCR